MAMLGCGVTEEVCEEDVDVCYEQCGVAEACFERCDEEYDACMESADHQEELDAAIGIVEFIGILFGDDDEDE